MATVTGMTAAKMLEIYNASVVGAARSGDDLLLVRQDGSQIDVGSVRGPQGLKGDTGNPNSQIFNFLPHVTDGTSTYVRLATVSGVNANSGGAIQFLLSGLGDYGGTGRATVLVHGVQRGSGVFTLRAWSFGYSTANSPITLFYKQGADAFTFEIWGLFPGYVMQHTLTVLGQQNATVNVDSMTTAVPSGLTQAAHVSFDTFDPTMSTRFAQLSTTISNGDLNAYQANGIYVGANLTNAPITNNSTWFFVEVISHNDITWTLQRVTSFSALGGAGVGPRRWVRQRAGNYGWTAWAEETTGIATPAEVLAGTDNTKGITPYALANTNGAEYGTAAGEVTVAALAAGAVGNVSITFPSGRFSQPPFLVCQTKYNRYVVQVTDGTVTSTGATIQASNVTSTGAGSTQKIQWYAVQKSASSGLG